MFLIEANDIDEGYAKIIDRLLSDSLDTDVKTVSRKGETMREEPGVFILKNPHKRLVQNPARKLSPWFASGEFLWIASQEPDLKYILPFNKKFDVYSDDGETLFGAYGPRIGRQLQDVVDKLKKDLWSRQAVINIGHPTDSSVETKDFPCNQTLHFDVTLSNHKFAMPKLNMTCFIRSQDMLWGFPYDVFHWTMLQEIIANELGVYVGEYRHYMTNCHLYMRSEDQYRDIVAQWKNKDFAHQSMSTNGAKLFDMDVAASWLVDTIDKGPHGVPWTPEPLYSMIAYAQDKISSTKNIILAGDYALRALEKNWERNQ